MLAIPLRLIERLVQTLRPPLDTPAKQHRAKAAEKNKPSSESVERLMLGWEEIRRKPMRALTDAVGDGDQRGFLRSRRGHQSCLPGQLQVQAVVRAADEEAGAEVACADVGGRNHNGRPDSGEENWYDDVVARFSELA